MRSDVPEHDIERGDLLYEVGPGPRPQGPNEEPHWDGQRFQVRDEDGDAVCDLEEWQVVKLFRGGLPPWPLEGVALQEIREILKGVVPLGREVLADVLKISATMVDCMAKKMPETPPIDSEPMPPGTEGVLALVDGWDWCSIALVRKDVPDVGIQAGDALVYSMWEDRRPEMKGRIRWLTLDEYATLSAAIDGEALAAVPGGYGRSTTVREFLEDQRKWGKRLKVWHSRLAVLRPPWESVTESIEATSDDAAIFELLHQVGGRMPI